MSIKLIEKCSKSTQISMEVKPIDCQYFTSSIKHRIFDTIVAICQYSHEGKQICYIDRSFRDHRYSYLKLFLELYIIIEHIEEVSLLSSNLC